MNSKHIHLTNFSRRHCHKYWKNKWTVFSISRLTLSNPFFTIQLQSSFKNANLAHHRPWLKNPWIIHHSSQSLNSLARCITPLVIWLLPPSEFSYIFQCTIPLPFNLYINHNKMPLVHLRESYIMTLTSRSLPRQSPLLSTLFPFVLPSVGDPYFLCLILATTALGSIRVPPRLYIMLITPIS